jgi:SAM-dependent methyltransferase
MNEISRYYGALAGVYGTGGYYAARRAAVIAAIAPELGRARSLLDLGCGNGAYLEMFSRRRNLQRIVGADLTEKMLRAARERVGRRAYLVRADVTAPPFREASFDLVFESHVLQLVRAKARCIRAVARILHPGGVLVSTLGGIGGSVRSMIVAGLSPRERDLALHAVFPGARRGARREGADLRRRVCEGAGLRTDVRVAEFEVDWSGLEESFRARTLPVLTPQRRKTVDAIFAEVRARAGTRRFALRESLLLGYKSAR